MRRSYLSGRRAATSEKFGARSELADALAGVVKGEVAELLGFARVLVDDLEDGPFSI
jgi:hypothetical protein